MTMTLSPPADLPDLAALSARVGSDPLLIQAAGGNTSVKDGDVIWIKASGTLLAEALEKDIFVPVDLPAMRAGLDDPSINADQPAQFALGDTTLRPSIETSLHAVFGQRVVIHVHCVNTLAHAVCADAEMLLAEPLSGFDWCLVPYARPGANLALSLRDRLKPGTDVVVLGNHGLVVAAETVGAAEELLDKVVAALTLPKDRSFSPDLAALNALADTHWSVPGPVDDLHQLADTARAAQAAGGSLYPDHVVFCGVAAHLVEGGVLPDPEDAPPFVIVPGSGVLEQTSATPAAKALSRCLSDVLGRLPVTARLNYLSEAENAELLDWDAEKYRRKLNV